MKYSFSGISLNFGFIKKAASSKADAAFFFRNAS